MLGQRILTAIVLLVALIAALRAPSAFPFEALMALFVGCALWEWLRLTLPAAGRAWPAIAGFLLGGALAVWRLLDGGGAWSEAHMAGWRLLWMGLALLWCLVLTPYLFRADASASPRNPGLSLLAPLALLGAWSALVAAHGRGVPFLLSLLAVVWVADIGAYFAGRAWGRRKLAPHISPGKTQEGALGGAAGAVLLVAACALAWPGSFGAALVARWGWALALGIALLLALLSIAGDLFESLLKRRAGVKDSSRLLPGHGGVLDRIDALIPVLPIAVLLS